LAGNAITAAPTSGSTFTVDNIAPTITSVTSVTANGYYKAGGNIDVAVNFSENVTSTGNVTVNFDSGGSCTFTVSNSATGTCTYAVGSGQNSADLNTSSITGTIADQATNAVTNFAPATSLASSKAIIVDTSAPTFAVSYYTDLALTQAAGNYLKPGTYYIKVAVTEAIGLAAAPNITINAEGTVNDVASAPTTLVATNVYRYSQVIVQDNAAVGSIAETITTTATDLAGNSGTGTDNSKFTDGKLPVTTVSVAGPNGQNSYYTSYPTITFNVDEVNLQSTQCKWDYQGSFSSCGSSTTPNQDGEHYLTYYSVDNAGNVEDTHTSVHYFFDTAAPNVSNFHVDTPYRVSGTKDAVANNSFVLNITASDVTSGANQMQFSYNGSTWGTTVDGSGNLTTDGSWESIASTKNWTVPNVEGESVLYIKVNDIAGNTFTAPALHIVLDTTNPTDPSLSVFKDNTQQNVASASTWYSSTAPYFSWTSLDGPSGSGIAGYYVYMGLTNSDPVASGVYQDCTGNPNCTVYNQTLANDGAYYFKVVAKDNVGRLSNLISFRYYLDKTPPDVVSNLTGTGMLITDAVRDKIDVSWNAYSIVAGQEAPIDYYEVERVKKSAYDKVTNNFTINGGTWNVPVDNVTNGYGSFKFYRGST
jgi:hypothetical protein